MVLNDFRHDWKEVLYQEKMSQVEVAEKIGKSTSSLTQIVQRRNFNEAFVEIYDKLGYDIRVEYVKREEKT